MHATLVSPPSEPTLNLRAGGAFDVTRARSGDTVRYRLRVEWNDVPAAVMVLPPQGDLDAPGFRFAGVSTTHRKSRAGDEVRNVTEFTYSLVAGEPGTARVSPFALRYRSGLSSREETAAVPGSMLEILPPRPVPWRHPVFWLVVLPLVAGVALALAGRALRRRRAAQGPAPDRHVAATARRIAGLEQRCEVADPRAWIGEAERLCVDHLCRKLGASSTGNVRFEAALDRYLAAKPAPGPAEAESWSTLRDLFHSVRYAGSRPNPETLRDACRHLKQCLQPREGIMT